MLTIFFFCTTVYVHAYGTESERPLCTSVHMCLIDRIKWRFTLLPNDLRVSMCYAAEAEASFQLSSEGIVDYKD